MTRAELYPELEQNPRRFDPKGFSWEKVKQFLADQVWTRTVSHHLINVFNQQIYIGKRFAGQKVTVTYDPIEETAIVRAWDGRLLKICSKPLVTQNEILEYANMSKN